MCPLPDLYLTADEPGIGGRLKDRVEDFFVEELPLYQPSGEGEHLYLFIEKRGRPTLSVIRDIARHFNVPPSHLGYAGMKDKTAVTKQAISVHLPGIDADPAAMKVHGVRLLHAARHSNKLRQGHLRGNRFSIRIRGVDPSLAPRALRMLRRLESTGVPNFIGEQRFGYHANNHEIGRRYILRDWKGFCDVLLGMTAAHEDGPDLAARRAYDAGDYPHALACWPVEDSIEQGVLRALAGGTAGPGCDGLESQYHAWEQTVRAARPEGIRFYLTAFQSAVFNHILARRLEEGLFDRLVADDVAQKTDSRALFTIGPDELADPSTHERLRGLEISPTGPMWGDRMKRAAGRIDELELAALAATGVTLDHLNGTGAWASSPSPSSPSPSNQSMSNPSPSSPSRSALASPVKVPGTRRPLRIAVTDIAVEAGADEHGPYLRTDFTLPRGAFATTVLRELMKTPSDEHRHPWGA